MIELNQLLLIFTVSLGIFSGFIVSKNAKEEIVPGRLYIRVGYLITIYSLFTLAIYYLSQNIVLSSIIAVLPIIILHFIKRAYMYYAYCVLIAITTGQALRNDIGYILPAVAFLALLLHGTLIYSESLKMKKTKAISGIIHSVIFLAISILVLAFF